MTAPTHSLSPSPSTSPKGVDQLARVAGTLGSEIAEHTKNGANGANPDFEISAIPQNEAAGAAFALVNQGFFNARAGDPLDSPAPTLVAPLKKFNGANGANGAKSDPETGLMVIDEPVSDQESTTGFYTLNSTSEEVEQVHDFTARQVAAMTDSQKEHARNKGRCFSLMQYRTHKETGEVMLTQEQIDAGLAALEEQGLLDRYAVIFHDKDVEGGHRWHLGTPTAPPKPLHMHAAVLLKDGRMRVGQVARLFDLPPSRVEVGGDQRRGRWAAEQGFFDLCQYLVHENAQNQGRRAKGEPYDYPYPRSEVKANFDFSEFLDGGLPGGGNSKKETLAERRRHLRRLVGQEGMTLEEAEATDFDAFADDLPRLEKLRDRYLEQRPSGVGSVYSKASVLITGASRQGKDVLGDLVSELAQRIASQAGQEWRMVRPSGENAAEDVGDAQIAHHEDVRATFMRSYDGTLRYLDPHHSTRQEARFRNRPATDPRLITMTSSCMPTELALTLKRRKSSDELARLHAEEARNANGHGVIPLDVDEFFYRLGFLVTVHRQQPWGLHDPIDKVMEQMVVAVYRVERTETTRQESVIARDGVPIGAIKTARREDLIAVIKGAQRAASFIVMELLRTHSPDVVAALPELFQQWQANEVPQLAMTPQQTGQEYEQRMLALIPGCLGRVFDKAAYDAMRDHMIAKHLHGTATPYPVDLFWYGEVRNFVYCRGEDGNDCGVICEVKQPQSVSI